MNAPVWLQTLGVVLTAVGALGGAGSLLLVRRQSSKLKVDTAEVLSRTSLALVGPLERRLTETDAELDRINRKAIDAERKADAATAELIRVQAEAEGLREETRLLRLIIRRWRQMIMNPSSTVEQIRELVGGETIL